jgi:hypothetical protein
VCDLKAKIPSFWFSLVRLVPQPKTGDLGIVAHSVTSDIPPLSEEVSLFVYDMQIYDIQIYDIQIYDIQKI